MSAQRTIRLVIETLNHPASHVDLTHGGVRVHRATLAAVASWVSDGTVAVRANRPTGGDAAYNYRTNTLHQRVPRTAGVLDRALCLHECVHILQDQMQARSTIGLTEAFAFVVQSTFFVRHEAPALGMTPSGFIDWVLQEPGTVDNIIATALRLVQQQRLYERRAQLSQTHLASLVAVLDRHPVYSGKTQGAVGFDGVCGRCM